MSNDILRNHWKYQTSWTDGFTCTHVKLQPKPTRSRSPQQFRRNNSPVRGSKSTSPEPKNTLPSRTSSRASMTRPVKKKTPSTPIQMLDYRRELRASRQKPWTEKPKLKNNKNIYVETYYENCLPPGVDLDELKKNSRKYVANTKYGNIYQIRYNTKKKSEEEKEEEPQTWMWEKDYNVWIGDNQRTLAGRSKPVGPTYKSTPTTSKGISVGHHTTRAADGYCNIVTKRPSSTLPTPRSEPGDSGLGQSITDRPNAELFAHYNAYRLNKQERRAAAIRIQSLFKGYTVRHQIDRLKRKVVLDHGRSWKNFIKDYKELISRVRSRYGMMKNSCPIVLSQVESFMDVKYKYEREFDRTATKGKLNKEDLSRFLKNCNLHPTDNDIITTFNKIYQGDGTTAEVVLVLDCSTSVGTLGFRRLIQFVKDLICSFEIGPDKVRVGVLPFNEDIFQSFSIFTYTNKHDILNAIDTIQLKHGLTRTHLAIKEMTNMLSNSRPGVRKVGIVITDGKSSEPGFTESEAKRAHKEGNIVYAIGVGDHVDMEELQTLAAHQSNVFNVKDYNKLIDITDKVSKVIIGNTDKSLLGWDSGICRPLNCPECMEVLWTLYPPSAADLAHVRRSRWIRPIIQGTEAWTLMDEKTKSSTDMTTCLRVVVQSRIDKNGYVMLPALDSTGVEYVTDVDKAVGIIQEWINTKNKNEFM